MAEYIEQKRKKQRSPAYPSIDLGKAIPLVQKLDEKFSDDPFSRDTAVGELGLKKGGDSFRKIAALVHFGLIERKGSRYKITDLSKRIKFPGDNEDSKDNAIKEAAKNPKLYKTLISHHAGKQLPTALHHWLITEKEFNRLIAEKVVKDFRTSLEFAGILKNGIITESEEVAISEEFESSDQVSPSINDQPESELDKPKTTTNKGLTYVLGNGITMIVPEDMVREITMGKHGDKFAKVLEEVEKLGNVDKGED